MVQLDGLVYFGLRGLTLDFKLELVMRLIIFHKNDKKELRSNFNALKTNVLFKDYGRVMENNGLNIIHIHIFSNILI